MKELSAIEKLEVVKLIMETLGYEFDNMTVDEAFSMFNILMMLLNLNQTKSNVANVMAVEK